jgi:hypothetical protein
MHRSVFLSAFRALVVMLSLCVSCNSFDRGADMHFGAHITTAKADRAPEQPRWHAFLADDAQAQAKAGQYCPFWLRCLQLIMQVRI